MALSVATMKEGDVPGVHVDDTGSPVREADERQGQTSVVPQQRAPERPNYLSLPPDELDDPHLASYYPKGYRPC